jgi:uncharacterized protein (TIGR00290 family)
VSTFNKTGNFWKTCYIYPVKIKTYFNWSSGKDAALALYYLQQDQRFSVERLLTSVNTVHNRVSMHGLRRSLLIQQIEAIRIPVTTIDLPEEPSMEEYESGMGYAVEALNREKFTCTAFGDIFLEDLRTWRENQLAPYGIKTFFPLWKKDTRDLIKEFMQLGFKAITVCVDANKLNASFAGRIIDEDFLRDLPEGVNPCGENGEFHTFCFDGPIFSKPVPFERGEKIYREYKGPGNENSGFWFCDLI